MNTTLVKTTCNDCGEDWLDECKPGYFPVCPSCPPRVVKFSWNGEERVVEAADYNFEVPCGCG